MTNQIRVTKPMQDLIARFKMLTQTYERRVGYETVSCENVPDGEVICQGLHRACQYLESRLEELGAVTEGCAVSPTEMGQ